MCLEESPCILGLALSNSREVNVELTLGRHGLTVKVVRERAEESTTRIVKRVHRRHHREQHGDHHRELLWASGTRYVSPLR
jgi:hypothetical protein